MHLVLHDWGPSPFCLKIRAILEHKGLDYTRRPLTPTSLLRLTRQGGIGKVPALEMDGRLVVDSTDIAHALDALVPDPPLLPADARARALCHVIEDWADESLYFLGLWFMWQHPEGARLVPQAFKGPMKLVFPVYRRRVLAQLHGQGTGRKSAAHLVDDLARHLDAAEALLDAPFLFGEAPTLADFALAAQLVYLSRTPVGGARIGERARIGAYLERVRALRR